MVVWQHLVTAQAPQVLAQALQQGFASQQAFAWQQGLAWQHDCVWQQDCWQQPFDFFTLQHLLPAKEASIDMTKIATMATIQVNCFI